MQDATIIVWGTPASPFVNKVLLALTAHDLAYEIKPVLPSTFNIPVLEMGSVHVEDSAAILYYLDIAYVQTLYPSDPAQAICFPHKWL